MAYIKDVLESGWLTTASRAHDFERLFAEAVEGWFACAVNSCTSALHLALEALDVKPGDEVIVPTMTFTATAEVIRYLGADPVLADVEYGTGLITPEIVLDTVQRHPRAQALIVVHYAGQPALMLGGDGRTGILEIAGKPGSASLKTRHAFPTRWESLMIGGLVTRPASASTRTRRSQPVKGGC